MKKAFLFSALFFINLYATPNVVPIDVMYSKGYELCDYASDEYAATRCIEKETAYQDKLLNKAYKEAMKRVDPIQKKPLRDMQRLWIRYTEAKCGFLYSRVSGTAGLSNASQCKLDETIKRTLELKETY